jgi:hypothetical protein
VIARQRMRLSLIFTLAATLTWPARSRAQSIGQPVHVLDVQRVRADQPARAAILTLTIPRKTQQVFCDVLVVGASTGGVAAALAVARENHSVCMTEETNWVGGQMTAQGVSAFDGNAYIETTGATASFEELRHGIRKYYREHYRLSTLGRGQKFLNPGNCWVSRLCFQAPVALKVLTSMLEPYEDSRLLRIFLRTKPVKVERQGRGIESGKGKGYPGFELITTALGSPDGLSQFPYIRESRRIQALATIKEQEISAVYQKGPRTALFPDSVGIGLYSIDIHGCSGRDDVRGILRYGLLGFTKCGLGWPFPTHS